jgi:hypothetical protein
VEEGIRGNKEPLRRERRRATVQSDGETISTVEATPLKCGLGAAEEVGWEVVEEELANIIGESMHNG